jgi:membrane protease subunit HflK
MRYVLLSVLAVVLLVTLWTSVTQVNSGERGVVRRFGKVIEVAGPGLYIGLPWGIDRVERVAVNRQRRVTIGYSDRDNEELSTPAGQLLTGDHNLVNIQVVIDYEVNDTEVEQFVLYGDKADGLVARAAEAVLAEWIASRGVDEVFLTGKVLLPTYLVRETSQRIAPYQLGVQIKVANVAHLFPPREVKAAFDDVTRAQSEIQTLLFEADQEADRLRREANMENHYLKQQAKARAGQTVDLAVAQSKGFKNSLSLYHALSKENANYLTMVWWNEMNRMYAKIRETGRIDLLDHLLAPGGLDIWQMPLSPKK